MGTEGGANLPSLYRPEARESSHSCFGLWEQERGTVPVSARPSTHEQQREISTSLPHTGGDLCTVMTHGKDMLQCPALFAVFMCAAMVPLFILGLERDALGH